MNSEAVEIMTMPTEHDPYNEYLDAVFARIDRLRHIDASLLTQRYGIDPSVLDAAAAGRESWLASQVLASADAQREELREHLSGLTQEYVAEGSAFDTAVAKAQAALGNPEMLAKQITRSTAQSALEMDSRWFPWMRSITPTRWLLPVVLLQIARCLDWPLLPALAVGGAVTVAIAFTQGYSVGVTITSDLWRLFSDIRSDLKKLLKLPVASITLRQRANRLRLSYTAETLEPLVSMTNITS